MRFAIILGILLIAIPLVVRAGTADPWADASSYRMLGLLEHGERETQSFGEAAARALYSLGPPQLVLLILGAITLGALCIVRPSEPFIILIAASPAFLMTFTQLGVTAVSVTIMTIAAALLVRKQAWALIAIPVCVSLDAASGILATVVLISIALNDKKPFLALIASFTALISCLLAAWLDSGFGLTVIPPSTAWQTEVLGVAGSATLLIGFLAAIGFTLHYRTEHDRTLFLIILLVPFVSVLEHGVIIAASILAYFAATAWEYLSERTWSFAELRSITLIILVCSLLFTATITVRERSTPDNDRISLLRFTRGAVPAGTTVLADKDIQGVLERDGVLIATTTLPNDPSFIASTLREQGVRYIITRDKNPPYSHFPIAYAAATQRAYRVYAVPQE